VPHCTTCTLQQERKIAEYPPFDRSQRVAPLTSATSSSTTTGSTTIFSTPFSILNRTLIDKLTNIRIGKRAPSDYLEEIRSEQGDKFQQLIESHLLPSDALLADNHEDFINQRQALLWEKIQEVTS